MNVRMNSLSTEAMTDPLTGLYNRRGFDLLVSSVTDKSDSCLISLDVDFFKKVNDRFGHDAGDTVLISLSAILSNISRKNDVLARFGGEEFIIFMPKITVEESSNLAERIRKKISQTSFPFAGNITLSAGVAPYSDCGSMQNLLVRADEALYESKKNGRNRTTVYSRSDRG